MYSSTLFFFKNYINNFFISKFFINSTSMLPKLYSISCYIQPLWVKRFYYYLVWVILIYITGQLPLIMKKRFKLYFYTYFAKEKLVYIFVNKFLQEVLPENISLNLKTMRLLTYKNKNFINVNKFKMLSGPKCLLSPLESWEVFDYQFHICFQIFTNLKYKKVFNFFFLRMLLFPVYY